MRKKYELYAEAPPSMTHLDSWDALGEWGMQSHELENYFDVPIGKEKK